MADYNSLYIGKVVYDSDLLNQEDERPYNRVKVYILGVSSNTNDAFQATRGKNNPNPMSTDTLNIVGNEFYAYVMQPVMGSGTATTYNANKDLLSVSDMGNIDDLNSMPPAENYYNITDAFVGGQNTGTAGVNPTAHAYSPDNRSNAYKGMMALPGVNSTVVVSFIGGKRGRPVIVGILPGAADVDSIHGIGIGDEIYPNMPFAYSNLTQRSETDG